MLASVCLHHPVSPGDSIWSLEKLYTVYDRYRCASLGVCVWSRMFFENIISCGLYSHFQSILPASV